MTHDGVKIRRISIIDRLSHTTRSIALMLLIPALVSLVLMFLTTARYQRAMSRMQTVAGLKPVVSTQLPEQLFSVAAGRTSFEASGVDALLDNVNLTLDRLLADTQGAGYLELTVARRTMDTLAGYVEQARQGVAGGAPVGEVEQIVNEVRDVGDLITNMLDDFISVEIDGTARTGAQLGQFVGLTAFAGVLLLVVTMLLVAFALNPLIVGIVLRQNPYPLIMRCIRTSGVTAFFTRSSAANIPVNMELCEDMGLDEDMYSVSIPLGATINMNGAAVTISTFTLVAAFTTDVPVTIPLAIMLSIIAALAACGASGVAGGSLLLIPMACSLFGISNDVAMQVVGVGFIIGVVQDSVETMLNSSGDVMFAATAEYSTWIREGRSDELPTFLGGKRKLDV